MNERQVLGGAGEKFVASWLQEQGFEIVARNFRLRTGEIDIIAERGEVVSFVEVKTRNRSYFHLSHVITPSKQRSIITTAKLFAAKRGIRNRVLRFDVALLKKTFDGYSINYIPNAFQER